MLRHETRDKADCVGRSTISITEGRTLDSPKLDIFTNIFNLSLFCDGGGGGGGEGGPRELGWKIAASNMCYLHFLSNTRKKNLQIVLWDLDSLLVQTLLGIPAIRYQKIKT